MKLDQRWRIVVALSAAILIALLAFGELFTTFAPWDDEGYFLQAYRDFLAGRVLFDQVASFYGPLTFFTAALAAGFDAGRVTPDISRWMTLAAWLAIAACFGGVVWRWTRQAPIALLAFLLIGFRLKGLAKSVGHPQVWIILLTALLLLCGLDWLAPPGRRIRPAMTGVILAAVELYKINIGAFLCAAVALAVALRLPKYRAGAVFTLMLAALALGLFPFARIQVTTSECLFAAVYSVSLVLIAMAAIRRPVCAAVPIGSLLWAVAGVAGFAALVVGISLALGITVHAMIDGLITAPSLLARSYHNAFGDPLRKLSVLIALSGVILAGMAFYPPRFVKPRAWWTGALKAGMGFVLFCGMCYDHRLVLSGSLLYAWLLVWDVPRLSEAEFCNRLLLALVSVLYSLQVFPMAGEQVDWASLPASVMALVLLADGIASLKTAEPGVPALWRPAAAASLAALGVALVLAIGSRVRNDWTQWSASLPLDLPGAHWLRLPDRERSRAIAVVGELRKDCDTVLSVPGLYSFALWSSVPAAESKRLNSWPFLWPDEVQRHELQAIKRQPRGCVLVSEDIYGFLRNYASAHRESDLLAEVRREMRQVSVIQDIRIYKSASAGR